MIIDPWAYMIDSDDPPLRWSYRRSRRRRARWWIAIVTGLLVVTLAVTWAVRLGAACG